MNKKLSIAIISDLHAYVADGRTAKPPSHLPISSDAGGKRSPFDFLEDLIVKEKLQTDLLFCAGDMGDQANRSAQEFVWRKLHEIGGKLGTSKVIGTAGNHDMDSRYSQEFDAKGILQSLKPSFPGLSEAEADRYWARNYVISELGEFRILILNSAAYHGGRMPASKEKDPNGEPKYGEEYAHGRVSDRTIAAISAELESKPVKKLNILLCHHHPLKNDRYPNEVDNSEMLGGDRLIAALTEAERGSWLIIHGHKHLPRLWYAGGDNGDGPVIISAGSFSAHIYEEIKDKARNQFYIVEFDLDDIDKHGCGVVGTIRAWDFANHVGWKPAAEKSPIPAKSGFGWRAATMNIARQIYDTYTELEPTAPPSKVVPWSDMEDRNSILKYMNQASRERAMAKVLTDYNLRILSLEGVVSEIGPKP